MPCSRNDYVGSKREIINLELTQDSDADLPSTAAQATAETQIK